jgi:MinD-like ATPase involved in chromosome partitioning or flagellar assembly
VSGVPEPGGSLVLVAGACGGCGASLVAGGLALRWAGRGATWLLELDLERGDLAGEWGLAADRTLADLAPVAGELDDGHLAQAAVRHPTGLMLLVAPGAPGAEVAWDEAGLVRLGQAAAAQGRAVVDAGAGPSRAARALAGRARAALVVCPPRLSGARRAARLVGALAAAGAEGRTAVVVNRGAARGEIGARALGRAVGASVVAELPWSEEEGRHLSAGRWSGGRRRRLRAAVAELAEAVG